MNDIIAYAIDLGWLQWLALFFNISYVILAARQSIWCWAFGLVGVSILLYVYIDVRLYSDATLQVFYAAMSVYGWITWSQRGVKASTIKRISTNAHFRFLGIGAVMTLGMGLFWQSYGAAMPFIDACTTSFSIIATFMVAKKVLENWIYWIVIDAVSMVIYWIRDIPLIAILFFMYVILACFGYFSWKKQYDLNSVQV